MRLISANAKKGVVDRAGFGYGPNVNALRSANRLKPLTAFCGEQGQLANQIGPMKRWRATPGLTRNAKECV